MKYVHEAKTAEKNRFKWIKKYIKEKKTTLPQFRSEKVILKKYLKGRASVIIGDENIVECLIDSKNKC